MSGATPRWVRRRGISHCVSLVTKYGPAIAIEWSAININTRTNVFLRIFHLRFMYEDMRYGAMHKLIYYELHA